jgi:hypothetical protein
MTGKDGPHSIETEASSLFAAAHKAMVEWGRLWWYLPDAPIEVRAGERVWRVDQHRVRAWYGNGAKRITPLP